MDQLKKLWGSIADFWKRQTQKIKILIVSVAVAIVAISIILTVALNQTSYVTLFTDLDAQQSAEIMAELQSMGVQATSSSAGEISVPKDQALSLQMQLAVKGYPRDTVNYDEWDESIDMFSTDTDKREASRRSTEARLTATYKTLAGIQDAIVSLDIPEVRDVVINDEQKPATASVVLHLKAGYTLSSEEITGIKSIAAGAVSTLEEENVFITDGTGALLIPDEEGGTQQDTERDEQRLEFKTQYEQLLKDKITELLLPLFGEDGIAVSVNALLNYDKKVSEGTTYTPSNDDGTGMVDQNDTDVSMGGELGEDGVVGTDPNADDAPNYPTIDFADTGEGYYERVDSTHYLVNTEKEQIEKDGYSIDDISISVTLNKEEMELGEREQLSELVAFAAGATAEQVVVFNGSFLTPGGDNPIDNPLEPSQWTTEQLLLYGGVLLVVLILIILVVMLVTSGTRKRKRLRRKQAMLATQAGEQSEENIFNMPVKQDFNIPSLTEAAKQDTKESVLKREIGEFAMTSPEIAAQLIRSWLKEEDM